MMHSLIPLTSALFLQSCTSFTPPIIKPTYITPNYRHIASNTLQRHTIIHQPSTPPINHRPIRSSSTSLHQSIPPAEQTISSFLLSVETFDGNSIVDPVVVSSAFWAGLKGKIVSILIGQLFATLVFVGLSTFFVSWVLPKVKEIFASKLVDVVKGSVSNFESRSGDGGGSFGNQSPSTTTTTTTTPDFTKLLLCIVIDTIGTSSELIPFLGEITDIIYAPLAAVLLRSLYGSNIVFGLEFVEEILPFTDVLPLATICWVIDTFYGDSELAKLLQIGGGRRKIKEDGAIDVTVEEDKDDGALKRR